MPSFSEKSTAEDPLIEKLKERGWNYVPGEELDRESFDEPLLLKNFVRKVREINKDIKLEDVDINNVVNELKLRGTRADGCRQVLDYLKKGVPIKLEKSKLLVRVLLFDYGVDCKENNEFIVSRQVVFHGRANIRLDTVLFVNGIPLVVAECKNAAGFGEDWTVAYKDILSYEQDFPELFKYAQIGVAIEQAVRYFPIAPWRDDVKTYEWKVEGVVDPLDAVMDLLSPCKLLDVVHCYIFHRFEKGREETKVVPRYMQYNASELIVKRVLDNLAGRDDKNRGLIWHWQGSGKTLTMIFAANKLYYQRELENPSVFFIVDRLELRKQLDDEISDLSAVSAEVINSVDDLKCVLEHDGGRGKRGVFITLIHKFRTDELYSLQKELEEKSGTEETILNRKNVIAFIDEGHRTQYGTLAAQMRGIFQSAFFFAFTGTPIAKDGKDTYASFGYPPDELYLDKYFVTKSLTDEFTVSIVHQPRLKKAHLDKAKLELFLDDVAEEIPETARNLVEEKVKERLRPINLILENPARINMIGADIANHFTENVEGRFKAMVVAASRKACVYYKKALDKHLPPEYSEVVMTYNREDEKDIREYYLRLVDRFRNTDTDKIKESIVDDFLNENKNPRILIVTDMLLAGFDAPILQTMYLDKPLKEHRLLQAVARTNRPYKDLKEAGVIIDYVGIFDKLDRAFKNYLKEDWKGAIEPIESKVLEFDLLIAELLSIFKDLPKDDYDRSVILKALEILTTDEQKGNDFYEKYKKLRKKFELIGAHPSKLRHLREYEWISAIYASYVRTVLRDTDYEEDIRNYYERTVKCVHEAAEMYDAGRNLPAVKYDVEQFNRLEDKAKSIEEKAASSFFTLHRFILTDKTRDPVYESLADRIEHIFLLWKEKSKDYKRIDAESTEVLAEKDRLKKRQQELNFKNFEYAILLVLEKRAGENEGLVNEVKELSELLKTDMFTGWLAQSTARKNAEGKIRRFVRRFVKAHDLDIGQIDEIYSELIEKLKNYEQ
jgi:type I restriction enzyme R subunit